jgi:opacity protein-like surface antigen
MKQRSETRISSKQPTLTALAVALACCAPLQAVAAEESPDQLKQRIELLENQVKRLETMMEQSNAKADAAAAVAAGSAEQQAEFDRIRVKVEGMEDQQEAMGTKDLKISGEIDPTYIYNIARNSGGFNFLGNFDGRDDTEAYAYDNSYFGQVMLKLEKELEGGTQFKLVLAPHKSAGSGYNLGSIVHEATMSVPLGDQQTRFIAGQFADWSGYEYYFGSENKLITHNLLFDFAAPSFYTGAGVALTRGNLDLKVLIANMNKVSYPDDETSLMLTYRGDYYLGEFSGFGFAGQHGEFDNERLNMFEVDAYYTRGDLTLQGQIGFGSWDNMAFAGDAKWSGISGLAAYKFTPRFEGIARFDYLHNSKNGGGTLGTAFGCIDQAGGSPFAPATCPDDGTDVFAGDYRNGFGPSAQDSADYFNGLTTSIDGANRSALSLGLNYALLSNVMLKAEYRYDRADKTTFYYVEDGDYKKYNQVFGLSSVVSF